MKRRFHGILSISLILLASLTGIVAIAHETRSMALIYAGVLMAGWLTVIGKFCVKCPCRLDSCAHLFPGKLTKLFPEKEPGPVTPIELAFVGLALAAIFAFPQYWLWKEKCLMVAFWVLTVAALLEITFFVCRGCANRYCPNCRKEQDRAGGL